MLTFITSLTACHFSFRPNRTVVCLSLGFSVLLLGAIFIEWYVFEPFLEFFTLFFGVFIGFYSVRDIYDGKYTAFMLLKVLMRSVLLLACVAVMLLLHLRW
jgi:hypothetical protein